MVSIIIFDACCFSQTCHGTSGTLFPLLNRGKQGILKENIKF
ncbi:MAG: hypothetical protein RID09_22310 [Coleofasciculus sp. G1-WW12-02]